MRGVRGRGSGGWRGALLLASVAVAAGAFAAGCGGGGATKGRAAWVDPHPVLAAANHRDVTGVHGGRFVFVTIGDPKTFNPILANETSSTDITNGPLFAGLVTYDNAEQRIEPALAQSWEPAGDGLSYTFHLRPGLQWSDGKPLTADDVIFSMTVATDTTIQSAAQDIFRSDGRPWRMEKVDSVTVRLLLPAPFGAVPEVIGSLYMIPEHVLGPAYRSGRFSQMWGVNVKPESLVTCGPFVLKEYVPGEKAVLARNPYYWEVDRDGKRLPYLDEYVYLIVKDLNTMALKFQAGQTDLIDPIVLDQVPLFEDEQAKGGYRVVDLGTDLATDFLWFNLNPGKNPQGRPYVEPWKRRIFEDVRFRRAVSHAINRDGIVKSVLQGHGVPLYGPISSSNKLWHNPDVTRFPYDPEKAKALLDDMGLVDRNGDGIRETPDGKAVEFTLHTNSENNLRKAFGTVIAEDLAKVGIRVNFVPLEFNTIITRMRADYQYEAILLGLSTAVPPDPALSNNVYRSSGQTHNWNPRQKTPATPAEAEIDHLMEVASSERDYPKRKAAFDRVQELMAQQQFCIYIVNRNLYVGIRDRLQNTKPSVVRQHVTWNIQELWVKPRGEGKP